MGLNVFELMMDQGADPNHTDNYQQNLIDYLNNRVRASHEWTQLTLLALHHGYRHSNVLDYTDRIEKHLVTDNLIKFNAFGKVIKAF